MDAEIQDHIDRFVEEIVALAQRAGVEALTAAFEQVAAPLGKTEPMTTPTAAARPTSRKPRAPGRAARSSSKPEPQAEPKPAEVVAPTPEAILTEAAPSNGAARAPTEREVLVLDTVRSLGRASANEIVKRSWLPNGSVHVVLRSLVAGGRVARAKTDRGVEYSLAWSKENLASASVGNLQA